MWLRSSVLSLTGTKPSDLTVIRMIPPVLGAGLAACPDNSHTGLRARGGASPDLKIQSSLASKSLSAEWKASSRIARNPFDKNNLGTEDPARISWSYSMFPSPDSGSKWWCMR